MNFAKDSKFSPKCTNVSVEICVNIRRLHKTLEKRTKKAYNVLYKSMGGCNLDGF